MQVIDTELRCCAFVRMMMDLDLDLDVDYGCECVMTLKLQETAADDFAVR